MTADKGKSVLVTGAGAGIGAAITRRLVREGYHVFAAGRRLEPLQALADEIGGNVEPVTLDVTDEASIAEAVAMVSRSTGGAPLHALVNNAGISITGPVEEVPLSEWRRQFETNVFGVMNVSRAVLPQMREAGQGRIINIGSVTGRLAPPFMGVYAASKHAVEGFSDALRRELKPFGVHVSVIRPGFVNTGFGEQEQAGLQPYLNGPYAERLKRFASWHHDKGHRAAPPPDVVADEVMRALRATRPRTRYTAPPKNLYLIFSRNFLPAPLVDNIVARSTDTD